MMPPQDRPIYRSRHSRILSNGSGNSSMSTHSDLTDFTDYSRPNHEDSRDEVDDSLQDQQCQNGDHNYSKQASR